MTLSFQKQEILIKVTDVACEKNYKSKLRYDCALEIYGRKSQAFVMVMAVDNYQSLSTIEQQLKLIRKWKNNSLENIVFVLNKTDLPLEQHKVTEEDVQKLIEKHDVTNCSLVCTSALNDRNVGLLWQKVARHLFLSSDSLIMQLIHDLLNTMGNSFESTDKCVLV